MKLWSKWIAVILAISLLMPMVNGPTKVFAGEDDDFFKITLEVTDKNGRAIDNYIVEWYSNDDLVAPQPTMNGGAYYLSKDESYTVKIKAEGYDTQASDDIDYWYCDYFTQEEADAGNAKVKIKLKLSSDGLDKEKTKAVKELKAYKKTSANKYSQENIDKVVAIVSKYEGMINASKNKEEVQTFLAQAKKELDKIKSYEQIELWEKQKRLYFERKDGTIENIGEDGSFSLSLVEEGKFRLEGETGELSWICNKWYTNEYNEQEMNVVAENSGNYVASKVMNGVDGKVMIDDDYSNVIPFKVNVLPSEITELQLYKGGEALPAGEKIQLMGSEKANLTVKGKVGKNWINVPLRVMEIKGSDNVSPDAENGNFYMNEAGEGQIDYILRENKKIHKAVATASTYVPVTSIEVRVPKEATIDKWNGLGEYYVGVIAGNQPDNYSVTVFPDNASNKGVTWTSLTPEVANHMEQFLNGIIPEKAGLAKFEVSSKDNPEIKKQVQMEFSYLVPLTSVKAGEKFITMTPKSEMSLTLSMAPADASEQRFSWTYDNAGIVEIRDTVKFDPSTVTVPKWTVHGIKSKKTGLVTVTGIPLDTTGGAEPITFQVLVSDNPSNDIKKAKEVDGAINALGEITLGNVAEVEKACQQYDALSDIQKQLVKEGLKLGTKKIQAGVLKVQTADSINEMIEDLPKNITLKDKPNVEKANERLTIFVGVFGKDTGLVSETNLKKLSAANEKIAKIEEQKEEAVAVVALIDRIGEVTLDSKPAIDDAKNAYDKLLDEVKAYVINVDALADADDKYAKITGEPTLKFVRTAENNKNNNITLERSVIKFTKGKAKGLTLQLQAEFATFDKSKFGKVMVDGEVLIRDKDYIAREGSTIIQFTSEYVNNLKVGEHLIQVHTVLGYGEIVANVEAEGAVEPLPNIPRDNVTDDSTESVLGGGKKGGVTPNSVKTGDVTDIMGWFAVAFIAGVVMVSMRRQRNI